MEKYNAIIREVQYILIIVLFLVYTYTGNIKEFNIFLGCFLIWRFGQGGKENGKKTGIS